MRSEGCIGAPSHQGRSSQYIVRFNRLRGMKSRTRCIYRDIHIILYPEAAPSRTHEHRRKQEDMLSVAAVKERKTEEEEHRASQRLPLCIVKEKRGREREHSFAVVTAFCVFAACCWDAHECALEASLSLPANSGLHLNDGIEVLSVLAQLRNWHGQASIVAFLEETVVGLLAAHSRHERVAPKRSRQTQHACCLPRKAATRREGAALGRG